METESKSPFAISNIRLFIAFRIFFTARFYYPIFTILFFRFRAEPRTVRATQCRMGSFNRRLRGALGSARGYCRKTESVSDYGHIDGHRNDHTLFCPIR